MIPPIYILVILYIYIYCKETYLFAKKMIFNCINKTKHAGCRVIRYNLHALLKKRFCHKPFRYLYRVIVFLPEGNCLSVRPVRRDAGVFVEVPFLCECRRRWLSTLILSDWSD